MVYQIPIHSAHSNAHTNIIRAPVARRNESQIFSALFPWYANNLVFGLWYRCLDEGGPAVRQKRAPFGSRAFLFPQLQIESGERKATGAAHRIPHFVDCLFVAFNTGTALSPTATLVLVPRSKVRARSNTGRKTPRAAHRFQAGDTHPVDQRMARSRSTPPPP